MGEADRSTRFNLENIKGRAIRSNMESKVGIKFIEDTINDLRGHDFWPVTREGIRWDDGEFSQKVRSLFAEKKHSVAIAGKIKAGKSTFLNSILFDGRPVLPTDPTPETAKLTFVHGTDEEREYFEVEFYSREQWERVRAAYAADKTLAKKLEVQLCRSASLLISEESFDKFGKIVRVDDLAQLPCYTSVYDASKDDGVERGKYLPFVKCVHLYKDSKLLENVTIVDTPGTHDPNPINAAETKKWIGNALFVIYLHSEAKTLDAPQVDFFMNYLKNVPRSKLAVVRSKFDRIARDPYTDDDPDIEPGDNELNLKGWQEKLILQITKKQLCRAENVFPFSAVNSDPKFDPCGLRHKLADIFAQRVYLSEVFSLAWGELMSLVAAKSWYWEDEYSAAEELRDKCNGTLEAIQAELDELQGKKEDWKADCADLKTSYGQECEKEIDLCRERMEENIRVDLTNALYEVIRSYKSVDELRTSIDTDFRDKCAIAWAPFIRSEHEHFHNYQNDVVGKKFRLEIIGLYNSYAPEKSKIKDSAIARFKYELDKEFDFRKAIPTLKKAIDDDFWSKISEWWSDFTSKAAKIGEERTRMKETLQKALFDESNGALWINLKAKYDAILAFKNAQLSHFEKKMNDQIVVLQAAQQAKRAGDDGAAGVQKAEEKMRVCKKKRDDLKAYKEKRVEAERLFIENLRKEEDV